MSVARSTAATKPPPPLRVGEILSRGLPLRAFVIYLPSSALSDRIARCLPITRDLRTLTAFDGAETDDVSYAYVLPPPERDLFRILSATSARGSRGVYVARAYFESVCVGRWVMDDRTVRKLIPPWLRMSSRELRTAKTIFVACAL